MRRKLGRENAGSATRNRILILSLLSALSAQVFAQPSAAFKTPEELIRAFREMDSKGERLTARAWERAYRFFVKPERRPERNIVNVMEGEAIEEHPRVIGNRAKVHIRYFKVGQIDCSAGRFTLTADPSVIPARGVVMVMYDLVLTDTHWEFTPGREGLREVKGPPEWRIEEFWREPRVTIEAAIRYLTQLQGESKNEAVKRNTEKSIAALRRILKP